MDEIANIGPELVKSLSDSFKVIPNAQLGKISWEMRIGGHLRRPDAILDAVVSGRKIAFVVETRGDVFPREGAIPIWRIFSYRKLLSRIEDLCPG